MREQENKLASLKDRIIALEQHCLKPEVRSSVNELDRLLADNFLEIPSTGIPFDKSHALNRIPNEAPPIFTQQDYEIRILSEGLVQLIYKATVQKANEESISYSMRNSIWKLNGDDWQMIFHQGTPCAPFEIR